MTAYDTFTHEGMTIELHYDTDAGNPFTEFDQTASLRWNGSTRKAEGYGAEPIDLDAFTSTAHAARYLTLAERCLVAIPFRIVDYGSGGSRAYLTDTDDDRVTGFVVVTQEGMETTEAPNAEEAARQDFETFASWIASEVSGFVVKDPSGEELDSCWGFYGDDSYTREEAKASAEYHAAEYRRTRALPWLPTFGRMVQA